MTISVVQLAAVASFYAMVRSAWIVALDVAPYIASTATALSVVLAAATWIGARRTAARTRGVDAIRVTQDVMSETIEMLQEQLAQERRDRESERERFRKRIDELEDQLRECRGWVNQIRRQQR